ncbi:response regulator [Paenibacillus yanchengensis]|uniref:Response regulator n=1 Tax=Paenibacillus yanchengensis TaxID=2035833 RepID=A0ABW4YQL6_9BACL
MLNVMIVDDEEMIRRGLRYLIDWESFGCIIVAEAENGVEALEMANGLKPHIMIVDVRMPLLNGLELIDRLRIDLPETKFVILSGYDEFEYAKEAIDKGVYAYLLKPVNQSMLEEMLSKVSQELKAAQQRDKEQNEWRTQFEMSIHVVKEKLVTFFMYGLSETVLVENYCNMLGLHFKHTCFMVAVGIIESESAAEQAMLQAEAYVHHNFTELQAFHYEHRRLIVIWNTSKENNSLEEKENVFISSLNKLEQALYRSTGLSFRFGMGSPHDGLANINLSYREAVQALHSLTAEQRQHTKIAVFSHLIQEGINDLMYFLEYEKKMMHYLEQCDMTSLFAQIDSLFEWRANLIKADSEERLEIEKHFCMKLLMNANQWMIDLGADVKQLWKDEINYRLEMIRTTNLSELSMKMKEVFAHTVRNVQSLQQHNTSNIVEVKAYIRDNYMNDIRLTTVAEQFYMNPTYFSEFFKKETGRNYLEFLTHTRIEAAKKILIKHIELKTYLVAERVGYQDSRYFSQVFRKYTGLTPTDFRKIYSREQSIE